MLHRTERIAEALREELSELIGYELDDPRVASALVTDVHISPDKRHALVRVGAHTAGDTEQALEALEKAKHFLRRQLATRLEMYRIPELHFEADVLAEAGDRMDNLLKRIKKGRPRDPSSIAEKKAVE